MSVNSETCKARTLFITRGILNREIIPSVIVYSWVRSKLHNISVELLNIKPNEKNIDILSLDIKSSKIIKYLRSIQSNESIIYLSTEEGSVVYNTEKGFIDLPVFTNLSEESIGTNAGGISVITGEPVTVVGCEHYNKILTNYISSSIVVEDNHTSKNKILTVITPKRLISPHKRLLSILKDYFIKEKDKNAETTLIAEKETENLEVNPAKTSISMISVESKKTSNSNECKVFTLSIIERNTIESALVYFNWNHKKAAEALGIGRSTLYRKIKEYEIKKEMK